MAIVTTSRGASEEAQELAERLSQLIPGSELEQRGKKTIDQLAQLARKRGHSRIVLVTKGVHPSSIQFIGLDESAWRWLPEIINIKEFEAKGAKGVEALESTPELAALFEFESTPGGACLKKQGNILCFSHGKETLLEIRS